MKHPIELGLSQQLMVEAYSTLQLLSVADAEAIVHLLMVRKEPSFAGVFRLRKYERSSRRIACWALSHL